MCDPSGARFERGNAPNSSCEIILGSHRPREIAARIFEHVGGNVARLEGLVSRSAPALHIAVHSVTWLCRAPARQ